MFDIKICKFYLRRTYEKGGRIFFELQSVKCSVYSVHAKSSNFDH